MDSGGTTFETAGGERERRPAQQLDGAPPVSTRHVVQELGAMVGNRGLGQVLARMSQGDGILDGGVVHPQVESAIAASRGGGMPLPETSAAHLGEHLGDPLGDVRVHVDQQASQLARAVSARAFTVGNDIFFGQGEFRPGTPDGDALLAHEVTHVVQQRGAPAAGPLRVSQPGDAMEREAEAVVQDLGA